MNVLMDFRNVGVITDQTLFNKNTAILKPMLVNKLKVLILLQQASALEDTPNYLIGSLASPLPNIAD
jgi:hypothetical protein